MAVQERDYMKGQETASSPSAWIARLNDFGERHAKAIISLSTALIILTVLIFAKYFYDKSMMERAEEAAGSAQDLKALQDLKAKYGATPAVAKILYRLANQYNEEGRFEEAQKEYGEFLQRFPDHPLRPFVDRALATLWKNLKYEQEQKEQRLKEFRLQSHPRQMADLKDPRFQWGPVHEPLPVVEIQIGESSIKAELFEDDAPRAVAAFIGQCEKKAFDGMKLEKNADEDRIRTAAGAPPAGALPFEKTSGAVEEGALFMVRKEGVEENLAGQFQIALHALPDVKDVTVFGVVTQNLQALRALKKDETLKSIQVISKRNHPYEATPPQKP